jgi:hypothetical protein
LSLECYHKKSEKTGKVFTKHIYRPIDPPDLQLRANDLRALAGLAPMPRGRLADRNALAAAPKAG